MFTLATAIMAIFSFIGLWIVFLEQYNNPHSLILSTLLYVIIPAFGAYGTYFKRPTAILMAAFYFASQIVRCISHDSFLPNVAPITIALPFGDFAQGKGYLIDYFAIFMAIYCSYLFKRTINLKKQTAAR